MWLHENLAQIVIPIKYTVLVQIPNNNIECWTVFKNKVYYFTWVDTDTFTLLYTINTKFLLKYDKDYERY